MAKNTRDKEIGLMKRVGGEIKKLSNLANSLVSNVRGGNITQAEQEVDKILDTLQDTIHKDFNQISDVARRNSSNVYSLLTQKKGKPSLSAKVDTSLDLKDFFEADDGSLLAHFRQRHKNRAVYLDDLHVVSTQMHELGVALSVTRDSIITSDNLSSVVSRTLHVSNYKIDDSLSDDKSSLIERIESMEDAYDVHNKIKDHVVPNTLRFGTYYAYVIPYADLFQEMARRREENYRRKNRGNQGQSNRGDLGVLESLGATMESTFNGQKKEEGQTYDSLLESQILNNIPTVMENDESSYKKEELLQTTKEVLDSITIDNNPYPPFLLDESGLTLEQVLEVHSIKQQNRKIKDDQRAAAKAYRKAMLKGETTKVEPEARKLSEHDKVQDATADPNAYKYIAQNLQAKHSTMINGINGIDNQQTNMTNKPKSESYEDIKGAYFKLLDTRRVIPIEVMDEVIGYYYIHRDDSVVRRRTFSGGFNMEMTNLQSMSVEEEFMGRIAEQIADNVNLSFLKQNIQFKESIAKALVYNDAYRRNIHFQFIPAEYIQEFNVNEDEDGKGRSMLQNSVFYAKLYLAVLLFKIMIIISRSADQRLLYVRSSGLDTNIGNRIQSIAREFKRRELSFTDLMSYNAISSKVGQGLDLYIPLGTDDKRGIDFEVLPGQDVQLHTDLLEMLRNNAIIATDTPLPLVDTAYQVEFAKQISQSNVKQAGRTISYQSSFNRDITSLYQKLMRADGGFEEGEINSFRYTLLQPSSLNTLNIQEQANNAEAVVTNVVEYAIGKNSDASNSEDSNELKDILAELVMTDISPATVQLANKYMDEAKIILTQRKNDRKRMELEAQDGDAGGDTPPDDSQGSDY